MQAGSRARPFFLALCVSLVTLGSLSCVSSQRVRIASLPAGATVYVDGQPKSVTPTVIEVKKDRKTEILIEKEGFVSAGVTLAPRLSSWQVAKSFVFLAAWGGAQIALGRGAYPTIAGVAAGGAAMLIAGFQYRQYYEIKPKEVDLELQRSQTSDCGLSSQQLPAASLGQSREQRSP